VPPAACGRDAAGQPGFHGETPPQAPALLSGRGDARHGYCLEEDKVIVTRGHVLYDPWD